MTKFIDLNIHAKSDFCDALPPIISLFDAVRIDKPQDHPLLASYFASSSAKEVHEPATVVDKKEEVGGESAEKKLSTSIVETKASNTQQTEKE